MKTVRKTSAIFLIALMILMMLPQPAGAAAEHDVGTPEELTAALSCAETTTINLTASFDYPGGIAVTDGRTITIFTNGYTLNIINASGTALEVSNNSMVRFDWGPDEGGQLNAVSQDGGYAVYVHDGGKASVSNATATTSGSGGGVAVYADGSGSWVTVLGDAGSTNPYALLSGAAIATDGAAIRVEGDVICSGNPAEIEALVGAAAVGDYSCVKVEGNVEVLASDSGTVYGAFAIMGGTVIIDGNVTANGTGQITGAWSVGSAIIIDGNVTADGTGQITGAWSAQGGAAVINGAINVPGGADDIMLGDDMATDVDGVPGELSDDLRDILDYFDRSDLAYDAYLVYTYTEDDTDCFVYVKTAAGPVCSIGETGYTTLDDALAAAVGATTTIKLLQDIEYDTGIAVNGKTIVFDLNGYELYVENSGGNALTVGAGGVVDIMDTSAEEDGELLVNSTEFGCGVYAYDGGQATVTHAGGQAVGVYAAGGSSVHVKGMALGVVTCVLATGGGTVTVDGGVYSYGDGYEVVLGDVPKTEADGVMGTAPYENYLVYSDADGNIVRVKTNAVCRMSLTTVDGTSASLYDTLEEALEYFNGTLTGSTANITLLADIEYDTGIQISGRTLTLDLNGHTLDVTNSEGHGLEVGSGGAVMLIENGGEFNAASSLGGCHGVYAHDGGTAEVTNAGSSFGNAVYAKDGGEIFVSGNAEGFIGAATDGNDNHVEIAGDVTSTQFAVLASGERNVVIVRGNVSMSGAERINTAGVGIESGPDSAVLIEGTLTVTGTNATGVMAFGGSVIIQGGLVAPEESYVMLPSSDGIATLAAGDGVPGRLPDALLELLDLGNGDYLTYTGGFNVVYVGTGAPITGLPNTYTMYEGGRVIWNPSPDGGTWNWDHSFFSATFNSPATFTALKAGTSTITYTVGGNSQSITVTVREAALPDTGQSFTPVYLFAAGAALFMGAAIFKKMRKTA